HRALEKLVHLSRATSPRVVMLVAPNSPTRGAYLDFCRQALSLGTKVVRLPGFVWSASLVGGSLALSCKNRRWQNLLPRFSHNLVKRKFDCSATERLLGFSLHTDWQKLLLDSDPAQRANYTIPSIDFSSFSERTGQGVSAVQRVLYVGLGRIAHERHLPALE